MSEWLHEKAIDLITLILAFFGMIGAYVTGQRKSASKAARNEENVKGHLSRHDDAIDNIHRRLESGDMSFINEERCAQLRENMKQSIGLNEERQHNLIERRIDAIETKLDEVARNQLQVHQGQTQLSNNQQATAKVLSELVERLSRRSTDTNTSERRRHDD